MHWNPLPFRVHLRGTGTFRPVSPVVFVALSIVAEVLAASNGRDGGRLRDREEPIHDRPASPSD